MIHLDLGPLVRPCCYIKKEYLNPISVAVAAAYSAEQDFAALDAVAVGSGSDNTDNTCEELADNNYVSQ